MCECLETIITQGRWWGGAGGGGVAQLQARRVLEMGWVGREKGGASSDGFSVS